MNKKIKVATKKHRKKIKLAKARAKELKKKSVKAVEPPAEVKTEVTTES